MKIIGFQKLTLLDYPGKTACTVFTAGCNLRCPFCHNRDLVMPDSDIQTYSEEEIISYLTKRKGLIDGVCITGGEPMLMKDLPEFCAKLKEIGVSVKIDTNGFFPFQLKYIVQNKLCDYVVMDIKNTFDKYPDTIGVKFADISKVKESIEFLKKSYIDYEFRTTVCKTFHTLDDLKEIAKFIGDGQKYFLQSFVDSGALIGQDIEGYTPSEMSDMQKRIKIHCNGVSLRGV